MNIISQIENLNIDLANKGIKIRIEKRGNTINLRGPLPSKGNNKEIKNQRISLNLNANSEGFNNAKKLLDLLILQLQHNQFNWENWKTECGEGV